MARAADPALAEWWFDLVELAEESSLAAAEFCRRHEVSTASFYNWRRKFRNADRGRGGFVPVNVTPADTNAQSTRPCLDDTQAAVRIVWPQGVIMEIPATDRELVLLVAGTLAGSELQS